MATTLQTSEVTTALKEPMAGAISGRTRLFAVLGDPVAQVMAPSLMNRLFAENDVDAVLVPIEVSRGELSAVVEGLKRIRNLDGFLVTVPHKFAVGHHADRLSDEATLSGSTNAMRRESDGTWFGENFDGEGFVRGLLAAGHAVTDGRFTLVGAGGAGAAIAASLLKAGAATLSIVDTDRLRAEALAALFDTRFKGNAQAVDTPDVESDVVVNATPLGLREDDPLPFALDRLRADTIIADIVMKPAETRLLLAAARRGFRTHPGLPMLSEQIPLYREFFRIH